MELGFLSALDWRIHVGYEEFESAMQHIEKDVAIRYGNFGETTTFFACSIELIVWDLLSGLPELQSRVILVLLFHFSRLRLLTIQVPIYLLHGWVSWGKKLFF